MNVGTVLLIIAAIILKQSGQQTVIHIVSLTSLEDVDTAMKSMQKSARGH